jgi:hypothetical protein
MTKTLKYFSLLFVFIFSLVSAEIKEDQYRLNVTMVDPELHCFALSNNMICNTLKKNWETETLPEVGTEVYIKATARIISDSKNEGEVDVVYSQDPAKRPFGVWITPESKQNGLSFAASESVCTAPAGWIFSEEYRDVILLSDGSQWIKESAGKTVFGPGSRVVVSKQKDGGYSIIDLDASSYVCKCRASKVARKGKISTWHRYERVKPYVPETFN